MIENKGWKKTLCGMVDEENNKNFWRNTKSLWRREQKFIVSIKNAKRDIMQHAEK